MSIEWYIIARALHVAGVVVWIGGVFFVTFVLLPALKSFPVNDRLPLFERLEQRFGWFARVAIIVVGVSGLMLAHLLGFWARIGQAQMLPIHLMIVVWTIFALMLFALEPFVVHRVFHRFASAQPEKAMRVATILHWLLCSISFAAIIGGVMVAHGWAF